MRAKKKVLAIGVAVLAAGAAYAQSPVYDPSQLPAFSGKVQQFTLTGRGDIDGIILADGTEVKVPPHLSTQIAATVRVGDAITVNGLKAAAFPLVEATAVKNDASGQSVVDYGPPHKGPKGKLRKMWDRVTGETKLDGKVRMALHGPKGDVNGALLEDGTVVRMPPPEAAKYANLLTAGQTISIEGDLTPSVLGKTIEASAIGKSPNSLNRIDTPPPPPGGPEGRDAPPPPPRG